MSFSSLNRTKCVSHQGICISNESFFLFYFFLSRDPMRRGRQPLPWNHFLTPPNSRSIECSNRSHSKIRLAGYINFLNPLLSVHFKPISCNDYFGLLYGTFLTFTYSIKDKRGDLPTLLPQPASSLTVIVAHENSFLGLGI